MRYKVFFTTGENIVINDWQFDTLQHSLKLTGDPIYMRQGADDPTIMLHVKYITHIVPANAYEQEGAVVTPPSPESVAKAKAKEQDSIKSDPTAILNRVKEKQEETHG